MSDSGDRTVDALAARATAMQLDSAASPPSSPGLRLQVPNPFDPLDAAEVEEMKDDEAMATVSAALGSRRIATAPALPQSPRFEGRSMQDHRDFMRRCEM